MRLRVLTAAWSFARAGPRRQALVIEAIASLASARLMLAAHPFSRTARELGPFSPVGGATSGGQDFSSREARIVQDVRWAIHCVAPRMPFRAVCLQQAVAARAMLRRRGVTSVLHLGAGRDESGELAAHAWLDAAGTRVTGYPIAPHIVEIGCFT